MVYVLHSLRFQMFSIQFLNGQVPFYLRFVQIRKYFLVWTMNMMSYFILLNCHCLLSIDLRYVFIVMDTIRAYDG